METWQRDQWVNNARDPVRRAAPMSPSRALIEPRHEPTYSSRQDSQPRPAPDCDVVKRHVRPVCKAVAECRLFADIVEEVRGNQSFHALERWTRLKGGRVWRLVRAAAMRRSRLRVLLSASSGPGVLDSVRWRRAGIRLLPRLDPSGAGERGRGFV